jgi:hypothetical protein
MMTGFFLRRALLLAQETRPSHSPPTADATAYVRISLEKQEEWYRSKSGSGKRRLDTGKSYGEKRKEEEMNWFVLSMSKRASTCRGPMFNH